MYNYSVLLGAIRAAGKTQEELAKEIGLSAASLNAKLKNRSQFKQSEILAIMDALHLSYAQMVKFFFTKRLTKS